MILQALLLCASLSQSQNVELTLKQKASERSNSVRDVIIKWDFEQIEHSHKHEAEVDGKLVLHTTPEYKKTQSGKVAISGERILLTYTLGIYNQVANVYNTYNHTSSFDGNVYISFDMDASGNKVTSGKKVVGARSHAGSSHPFTLPLLWCFKPMKGSYGDLGFDDGDDVIYTKLTNGDVAFMRKPTKTYRYFKQFSKASNFNVSLSQTYHNDKLRSQWAILYDLHDQFGFVPKSWIFTKFDNASRLESKQIVRVTEVYLNTNIDDKEFIVQFPDNTNYIERSQDSKTSIFKSVTDNGRVSTLGDQKSNTSEFTTLVYIVLTVLLVLSISAFYALRMSARRSRILHK